MASDPKIIHVTISIDGELHRDAVAFARSFHKSSFSGQITRYFLDDMRANNALTYVSPAPLQTDKKKTHRRRAA